MVAHLDSIACLIQHQSGLIGQALVHRGLHQLAHGGFRLADNLSGRGRLRDELPRHGHPTYQLIGLVSLSDQMGARCGGGDELTPHRRASDKLTRVGDNLGPRSRLLLGETLYGVPRHGLIAVEHSRTAAALHQLQHLQCMQGNERAKLEYINT